MFVGLGDGGSHGRPLGAVLEVCQPVSALRGPQVDVMDHQAQSSPDPADDDWSRYLERPVEVVTVWSSHVQLMSSPHVQAVAAAIAERLGLGGA